MSAIEGEEEDLHLDLLLVGTKPAKGAPSHVINTHFWRWLALYKGNCHTLPQLLIEFIGWSFTL